MAKGNRLEGFFPLRMLVKVGSHSGPVRVLCKGDEIICTRTARIITSIPAQGFVARPQIKIEMYIRDIAGFQHASERLR